MTSKATPVATQNAPDAQLIFDLAAGFMRAKHLFAARYNRNAALSQ